MTSAFVTCPTCGRAAWPAPHRLEPCPLLEAEHEQRLRHAEAEHQARLEQIRSAPAPIEKSNVSANPWRTWWIFYIDPEEGHGWHTAGSIGGPNTADEAIQKTIGRSMARRGVKNFWAFALDKGEFGSYYELHYSDPDKNPGPRRIGPSGYVAEAKGSM
jgi:hypothetical protein